MDFLTSDQPASRPTATTAYENINGWLILDKPIGLNSTPALAKVRRALAASKAGHAGTLDGFASGVLPIALGRTTKLVPLLMDADKDYLFTVVFGLTSDSLEHTSTWQIAPPTDAAFDLNAVITPESIDKLLPRFLGTQNQLPPLYSALKIDGMRASDRQRAGEAITLTPRKIFIAELRLVGWGEPLWFQGQAFPQARFFVRCGKGTYVRALARDIAALFGSVSMVTSLRRTRVGEFSLAKAISLETLLKISHKPLARAWLISSAAGLDGTPVYQLHDESLVKRMISGQPLSLRESADILKYQQPNHGSETRIKPSGQAIAVFQETAICLAEWRDERLWPKRQLCDGFL